MIQCGHHDLKFVCYPIAHNPDGTQLINWIAERVLPADTWNREDWNRQGSLAEVIRITRIGAGPGWTCPP